MALTVLGVFQRECDPSRGGAGEAMEDVVVDRGTTARNVAHCAHIISKVRYSLFNESADLQSTHVRTRTSTSP